MSLVLYTYICCHIFKILESATILNTTPSGIKWYTWRYLSRLLQANSKLKTERQRTKIWTSLSFSVKTTTWGVWFLLLISALEIHKKRKAGNALPTVFHVGKGWWGQKSQKWLWVPGSLLTSSCPGGRCFKAILEQSFSEKKTNNMQAKGPFSIKSLDTALWQAQKLKDLPPFHLLKQNNSQQRPVQGWGWSFCLRCGT